jgi:hypothetical protein
MLDPVEHLAEARPRSDAGELAGEVLLKGLPRPLGSLLERRVNVVREVAHQQVRHRLQNDSISRAWLGPLRHYFGSMAVNRASLVQVQSWMGHSEIRTTARYLHAKRQAQDAAILAGASCDRRLVASSSSIPGRSGEAPQNPRSRR